MAESTPEPSQQAGELTNKTDQTDPAVQSDPDAPRVTLQLVTLDGSSAMPVGQVAPDERVIPGAMDAAYDPGATVESVAVPSPAAQETQSGSRPRKNTLAAAIRPRSESRPLPQYHPDSDELLGHFAEDAGDIAAMLPTATADDDEIPDETGGEDEWSLADQPTILLVQQMLASTTPPGGAGTAQTQVQRGLATNERATWRPLAQVEVAQQTPTPRHPKPTRPVVHPDVLGGPRYASPDGKLMPVTPAEGVPRVGAANPRMERFQELRERRKAHEQGERAPQDQPLVNDVVRSWWQDLMPGLKRALHVQHEARASGTYTVPAYLALAVSRLGDAFGKVGISTRELAARAHNTAAPTLKRWHDRAEQYAQGLIDRLEGGPIQQQAPFLAPGRIAVLFRSGVSIAQAQRLLLTARARPLRVIPRKHGFLALVQRGMEAEIADRLKQHPYVRDVVFMQYDDPSQSLSIEVPAIAGLQR